VRVLANPAAQFLLRSAWYVLPPALTEGTVPIIGSGAHDTDSQARAVEASNGVKLSGALVA
jgi:hypothetical protein